MKYGRSYLNARGIADRIHDAAKEGRTEKVAGGLAAREERRVNLIDEDNFDQVRAKYMNLVRGMFDDVKTAEDTGFADEGTGPDTLEVISGGGPKRNPIYSQAEGYPVETSEIQSIIIEEAKLRGIDPEVALRIFRHEGQGSYQSLVPREGKGSLNGREASFGPWQLYVGGGLGNAYQKETGRDLVSDNTIEGIRKQTQFALDAAAKDGWGAWYGRKPAGVGVRDGLSNATPVGNWRD